MDTSSDQPSQPAAQQALERAKTKIAETCERHQEMVLQLFHAERMVLEWRAHGFMQAGAEGEEDPAAAPAPPARRPRRHAAAPPGRAPTRRRRAPADATANRDASARTVTPSLRGRSSHRDSARGRRGLGYYGSHAKIGSPKGPTFPGPACEDALP